MDRRRRGSTFPSAPITTQFGDCVETLDLAHLRKLGSTARAWSEAGNPPPLTFTLEEWRECASIFPMEYADVLERHRVLHGDALTLEGIWRGA